MTRHPARTAPISLALSLLALVTCRGQVLVGREAPTDAPLSVSVDAGSDAARPAVSENDADNSDEQVMDEQVTDEQTMDEMMGNESEGGDGTSD